MRISRAATIALKLTGHYRPEDAEVDPEAIFLGPGAFLRRTIRGMKLRITLWGETICVTDGTLAQATANTATPEVQYLVIGTLELAMMDNLAPQPGRGNWIIHEDGDGPDVGRNNDLRSCLDDGEDADGLSDGCVRIGTINDLNAEWTGGFFDESWRALLREHSAQRDRSRRGAGYYRLALTVSNRCPPGPCVWVRRTFLHPIRRPVQSAFGLRTIA